LKAAVYYGQEDIRIEEYEDPKCSPAGAVIKVHAVGICGSDVRTYYSGSTKIKPPMIIGHEVVGEVVEIGPKHNTYKIGDRLAMAPGIYCKKCFYCLNDMTTMCENLVELAFQFPGGFAEYMGLPDIAFERGRIVPVPKELSSEHAALCEAPSSCIMAQERADVKEGDTVVVFGAGPIGCCHVQIAKANGAKKVILIDISKERLEMAEQFGADLQIDAAAADAVKAVKQATDGLGADKLIVAAPSAKAQKQAVEMSRKRGVVVLFGGLPKENPYTELDSNLIHYRDIYVIGHYGQEKRHVEKALEMISQKQISADKLITDVLKLDQIHKGFELMKDKKALKVLLKP
jgi:L-iditol 2-dehydrogenase